MPVQKFRNPEEAERALWCDEPDEAYLERLGRWWKTARALNPRKFPSGVFKYRSIEEANADRERWLDEHIIEQQARLKTGFES